MHSELWIHFNKNINILKNTISCILVPEQDFLVVRDVVVSDLLHGEGAARSVSGEKRKWVVRPNEPQFPSRTWHICIAGICFSHKGVSLLKEKAITHVGFTLPRVSQICGPYIQINVLLYGYPPGVQDLLTTVKLLMLSLKSFLEMIIKVAHQHQSKLFNGKYRRIKMPHGLGHNGV